MVSELCVEYARLIVAASAHDAPMFADDLARGGMDADHLLMMARRWREVEMEPRAFEFEISALADRVWEADYRD